MRSINHQVDIAREHIRFADRAAAFPITTVAMPPAMTLPPSSWSAHPLHRVSIVSLKNARQRYTEASIAYREFLGDRELERARKLTEQVLRHARALDHMLDPFTRVLAALRTKYAERSVAREHPHAPTALIIVSRAGSDSVRWGFWTTPTRRRCSSWRRSCCATPNATSCCCLAKRPARLVRWQSAC